MKGKDRQRDMTEELLLKIHPDKIEYKVQGFKEKERHTNRERDRERK